MFQAKKAMFIYCESPVHAGTGQAFGLVDNPIQREKHTGHPVIAGSGVKGALRHHLWRKWNVKDDKDRKCLLDSIFGPEAGNSDLHAGAISFTDAQLVAFPVRSVRRGFVYATSPICLARAARMLREAGKGVDWSFSDLDDGHARLINPALLSDQNLLLENLAFTAHMDGEANGLKAVAEALADCAIPDGGHFHEKLKRDLVLLSDTDFAWFVKQSTVVEAHVRIDDETGTAAEGGLFYTENLPPESILLSLAMATPERRKDGEMKAAAVLGHVEGELNGEAAQIGGDATTGRGLVRLNFVGGGNDA